jgi:hypothetical protein
MHPTILIGQNNQPVRFEGRVARWGCTTSVAQGGVDVRGCRPEKDGNSPRDQDLTNLIKVGGKQSALARNRQG